MNRFIIFLITLTCKYSYCYDYVCCENSCISSLTDLIFSLFLLIMIIVFSLIFSVLIAYFTGKQLDTIPIWLVN